MTGALSPAVLTTAAHSIGPGLLAAALVTPLVMLAACLSQKLRRHALALQWLAPLPALAAALLSIGGAPLAFEQSALRVSLWLDAPGAMLLAVAALLWIATSATAFAETRGKPNAELFAVCWLLTLTGSLGVFIASDLLTFYFVYALVSIPAFGLIAHDDDAASRRAGGVFMAFTVLGETFLLMGFVLLAAGEPSGSLRIADVMAALPDSPWRDTALALVIIGFGMKIGLVPLHGWMPLAYTTAPIPAAAVLSGAAVKAGVIGLTRFLPFETALPGWGDTLVAFGFISAFYGVAIGITQHNPKAVLAYSSISQMGVIAATLGMGLAAADKGVASHAAAPARLVWPWLAIALASILIPWLMYPAISGDIAEALTPATVLEALWPVLSGAALALGVWLWGHRLPRTPEGDMIVAGEAAFHASTALGAAFERMDLRLRQWPAAGLSLLAVALILAAAALFYP
jgi:formate hydrogenlyase subunit 3/multisubunit Na+/H+ antiporter MnhD subunit